LWLERDRQLKSTEGEEERKNGKRRERQEEA
jgi:hypothetical protein